MGLNLFWTREDKKLFPVTIKLAIEKVGSAGLDANSVDSLIKHLDKADDAVSHRGSNDVPPYVEKAITKSEWKKMWVEFHHYSGDLEEMVSIHPYPFPDFCLFFYFKTKLEAIREVPSSLPESQKNPSSL